jgi:hypothetical protein
MDSRMTFPTIDGQSRIAYIRGLAELHGRNVDWAERAVRPAAILTATAVLEQGVIEIIANDAHTSFSSPFDGTLLFRAAVHPRSHGISDVAGAVHVKERKNGP